MSFFTVYSPRGEIIYSGSCSSSDTLLQSFGDNVSINAESAHDIHYIPDTNNPVVTPKPANPTIVDKTTVNAYGGDFITLTNIPTGAELLIKGNEVTETVIPATPIETIDFDTIGTYTICISVFPYLDFEETISVI